MAEKKLAVVMPMELYEKLRGYAEENGRNMTDSQAIRSILSEYLYAPKKTN